MSFLNGWFGGSRDKSKAPAKDATTVINQNYEHQETLEDKAEHAEHKAKKCLEEYVRLHKSGNVRGADVHKKRAIMYRKQAATLRAQANNLIQQGIVLEEASSNAAIHETMHESLRAGQSLITHIDPDDVAETADDWAELYADSREVGRAMSNPLSLGDLSDGEEEQLLDGEIAQLMEAHSLKDAEDVPLPSVPTKVPVRPSNNPGGGPGGGQKVTPTTSLLLQNK